MTDLEHRLRGDDLPPPPPVDLDDEADVFYADHDSPLGRLRLAATGRGLLRVAYPDNDPEAVLDRIAAEVAPAAGLTPRFGAGPPQLDVAAHGPDAALALVLGIVFTARADGTWARLKACPHARCGWAFYDRSRNRSSQWCSMRICGNRTKGARHRARGAPR